MGRSTYYYKLASETPLNLKLMKEIDKIYTKRPSFGSRTVKWELFDIGFDVNRKRIQRLMRKMGLEVIYQKPNLGKPNANHRKFPYLLRGVAIESVNQVWSSDITYIPLKNGFLYLTAIMDWYSRYVLSWSLSNSMESGFCVDTLEEALLIAKPMIFNTDQGTQYTSNNFLNVLERDGIKISMDGKGRALDNIYSERLWRTVKYEKVYCKSYETYKEAKESLKEYFDFYNNRRWHQSLNYRAPRQVYLTGDRSVRETKTRMLSCMNDFALDV